MSKIRNTEYLLQINGDFSNVFVGTIEIEFDGALYEERIDQLDIGEVIVDLENFDSSQLTVSASIRQTPVGSVPVRGSEVTLIRIDDDAGVKFISQSGSDYSSVGDATFNASRVDLGKTVIKGERRYYETARVVGTISASSHDNGFASVTIELDHTSNFKSELEKFNKDTYGQYAVFPAEIAETAIFVAKPDFSPATSLPIGRVIGATLEADVSAGTTYQPFTEVAGVITPTSADITLPLAPGPIDISDTTLDSITESNRLYLNVSLVDFLNARQNVSEFYSQTRIVPGKLVSAFRFVGANPVAGEDGIELHFAVDPDNLPRTVFGEDTSLNPDEYKRIRYAFMILTRWPKDAGAAAGNYDLTKILASYTSSGSKVAPYALMYDSFTIRVSADDYSWISADYPADLDTFDLDSFIKGDLIDASDLTTYGTWKSYVTFNVLEAIDLRLHPNFVDRLPALLGNDGAAMPGIAEAQDGSGNSVYTSLPGVGDTITNQAFFDPEMLFADPREIEVNEWVAVVVPGAEVIRSVRVHESALSQFNPANLINYRVDALRNDTAVSTLVNIVDPTGAMREIETTHAEVYSAVSGYFGYIEGIIKTYDYSRDFFGYKIWFKLPRQADPSRNIASIPNTLNTFTDELRGRLSFLLTYRNPPENSGDENNPIPTIYGYVEKVPMINAISKKANYMPAANAGDDIYIVCSHPVCQTDDNSVEVWWGLDAIASGTNPLLDERQQLGSVESAFDFAKDYVLPNPFPTVAKIPVLITVDVLADGGFTIPVTHKFYYVMSNPFHYLVEVEDNFNSVHTGVKLRGGEVPNVKIVIGGVSVSAQPSLDDPRFYMKEGLGNSRLYASIVGMPDDSFGTYTGIPGGAITHPAHVMHHMIRNFASKDRPIQIDVESFERAYSLTPDLAVGVYMTDDDSIWDYIVSLASHSMIFPVYDVGKYSAHYLNLNRNQVPKHSFRADTDIIGIQSELFFSGVTDYSFQYAMYHPTGKFSQQYVVNRDNNKYCRDAYRVTKKTSERKVDFPFFYDSSGPSIISKQYVDLYSRARAKLSLEVMNTASGGSLKLFDVVSVTDPTSYNYIDESIGFFRERFIIIGKAATSNGSVTYQVLSLRANGDTPYTSGRVESLSVAGGKYSL